MKVITVANSKGGVGKSTLTVNIGRALQLAGHNVLVIDSDEQHSASDWALMAGDDAPTVVTIERPTLEKDVQRHGEHYDYIVIDTDGAVNPTVISAIKAADLVVIPVQASAFDIWGVADLIEIIERNQQITGGYPKAVFALNRIKKGTRLSTEVRGAAKSLGLPVLAGALCDRTAYAETLGTGKTGADVSGETRVEVAKLVRQIKAIFDSPQAWEGLLAELEGVSNVALG